MNDRLIHLNHRAQYFNRSQRIKSKILFSYIRAKFYFHISEEKNLFWRKSFFISDALYFQFPYSSHLLLVYFRNFIELSFCKDRFLRAIWFCKGASFVGIWQIYFLSEQMFIFFIKENFILKRVLFFAFKIFFSY